MKEQTFTGRDSNSIINFLADFKRACVSSQIQEGAAVWLFRQFLNPPAGATIKARLNLSSTDENRHEGTVTFYTEVLNHMLGRYTTDRVIAKADQEISHFKQGSLASWECFRSFMGFYFTGRKRIQRADTPGSLLKAIASTYATTRADGGRKTVKQHLKTVPSRPSLYWICMAANENLVKRKKFKWQRLSEEATRAKKQRIIAPDRGDSRQWYSVAIKQEYSFHEEVIGIGSESG